MNAGKAIIRMGVGFERAVIEGFQSVNLSEFEVLVLGAGGASRAAIVQALSTGSPKVHILINRSMERAEQLINMCKDKGFSQLPEIITEEQVDSFFGFLTKAPHRKRNFIGIKSR